jgi:serine protease Do
LSPRFVHYNEIVYFLVNLPLWLAEKEQTTVPSHLLNKRAWGFPFIAIICFSLLGQSRLLGDDKEKKLPKPPAVAVKSVPESIEDLKAFQKQTRQVLRKVIPCTVGLVIGGGAGSGVIVSPDGYVLTAGHVSGEPGRKVTIYLHDGRKVKAKSLGVNRGMDSGMVKITEDHPDGGKWPYVEMGDSAKLKKGQWCICTGHPGGYKKDRPPVVRVGRIVKFNNDMIRSDCTLVGGDSGGPLFDMRGKVIGIHSKIGLSISDNIHVPVDTYRATWDRLAKGEEWGTIFDLFSARANSGYLGVVPDREAKICRINEVIKGSPAEKAGLKEGDVISTFDGDKIASLDDLRKKLDKKKPAEEVEIGYQRDGATVKVKIKLAKQPSR